MVEVIVVMIYGLVIGSFLNVCIYRIPRGESISYPSSYCQKCHHPLKPVDLIPVFSYLLLKGKCRYCKSKISSQYIWIEILHSLLYGLTVYHFGLNFNAICICILISFMTVLTLIDIRYMLLPTSIIRIGVIVGIMLKVIEGFMTNDFNSLRIGIIGGVIGYGLLAILFWCSIIILKKEGMGYGDVRYLGLIGIYTSWETVLLTLFIASIVGAIYGIIQCYLRKRSEAFPFGPFLSLGTLISIFIGPQIVFWYMSSIWGIL